MEWFLLYAFCWAAGSCLALQQKKGRVTLAAQSTELGPGHTLPAGWFASWSLNLCRFWGWVMVQCLLPLLQARLHGPWNTTRLQSTRQMWCVPLEVLGCACCTVCHSPQHNLAAISVRALLASSNNHTGAWHTWLIGSQLVTDATWHPGAQCGALAPHAYSLSA